MKKNYSIKDLELISGIKAHTIRIWESRYDLIKPQRTKTNIRYYRDSDIIKLLNVAVVIKNGMKVSQVAKLSEEELVSFVSSAYSYQDGFEDQVKRLTLAMLEYDELSMNTIINSCIMKYGMLKTLDDILGPFINEVGWLWQTKAIGVGHEHFASNVLRMRLFSLIENLQNPVLALAPRVILFLPSGEFHELSLLYLNYHFKLAGFKVLYLGQDMPLEYVSEVAEKFNPQYLVSIFSMQPHFEDLDYYFERIKELFDLRKVKFYLSGYQLLNFEKSIKTTGIEVFKTIGDLRTSFLRKP